MKPRVKRGLGPQTTMTKATYRKKALPHLLNDFERSCAYCLDPNDFRHPSQDQVDHFNCKLPERRRHQYKNLMLACAACNLNKHDKVVINPHDQEQRLLNCTVENEFDGHIVEGKDGHWVSTTNAGEYHITSIELDHQCHRKKRAVRREMAETLLALCTMAFRYRAQNPEEIHKQIMESAKAILGQLNNFPPLIVEGKTITVREWLKNQGVDIFSDDPS
jgi:hypothetical protein